MWTPLQYRRMIGLCTSFGCSLALLLSVVATGVLRADSFDLYTNKVLIGIEKAEGVKELKQLTPSLLIEHDRVLKDATGALVVVRTNDERWCKLLMQPARQKIDKEKSLRILMIDRYVTYREGAEQTVHVAGKAVTIFPGFRLSLDLGQLVPEELSADVRFVANEEQVYLEPVKGARLFLVTQPLPQAVPAKTEKLVVGDVFTPRYFNGKYKLFDDGRRSGVLQLKLGEGGEITGTYTSDKDGQNYEVKGKVGAPNHSVQFTIVFPRSEQMFQGWLFTGDGKYLTGSSRLVEREAGFYALRIEE